MRIHLFSSSALLVLTFLIVAATVQADGNEQPRRSVRHKFSRLPAVKALPSKAKTTSTVTTPQPPKLLRGGSIVPAPSTMIRPIQTFLTALGEVKSHLAAAAVARSSSLLACYPIDTVKVSEAKLRKGLLSLFGVPRRHNILFYFCLCVIDSHSDVNTQPLRRSGSIWRYWLLLVWTNPLRRSDLWVLRTVQKDPVESFSQNENIFSLCYCSGIGGRHWQWVALPRRSCQTQATSQDFQIDRSSSVTHMESRRSTRLL